MDGTTIVSVLLPVGLGLLMFGIGLGLQWADFIRIKQNPRPVAVGMGVQLLLVPLLAVALNWAFDLRSTLAIGLLLLASSPGGAIANLYSHLAKGDVALNVTLSGLNAAVGVIFVPFMVKISYLLYQGEEKFVPVQFDKLVQVMFIMLVPLIIGIIVNGKNPQWAKDKIKWVNRTALGYIVLLVVLAVAKDYQIIGNAIVEVGLVVLLFNILSLFIGFGVANLMRLERRQTIAITMEIGIHHCSIIIAIAMSPFLLNSVEIAMPSIVYIFLMHISATVAIQVFNRFQKSKEEARIAS